MLADLHQQLHCIAMRSYCQFGVGGGLSIFYELTFSGTIEVMKNFFQGTTNDREEVCVMHQLTCIMIHSLFGEVPSAHHSYIAW